MTHKVTGRLRRTVTRQPLRGSHQHGVSRGERVALVAGASGIVGKHLSQALLADDWRVIALYPSRRFTTGGTETVAVELRERLQCQQRLTSLTDFTPVFYSAWLNAADWAAMAGPNLAMLQNLVQPIEDVASLEHVSLMQGYNVYGAHLGRFLTACFRRCQRSRIAHRKTLFPLAAEIEFQQAVNPLNTLMIPGVTLPAKHLIKLPKSVSRIALCL